VPGGGVEVCAHAAPGGVPCCLASVGACVAEGQAAGGRGSGRGGHSAAPTVFVLLQKGQLKAVSSLGAAALGGGLAELLRLPIARWRWYRCG